MATVLPNAERGLELGATRISVEPPNELPIPSARRPYGPGDVIDKYELESLLGKGGMGEVWTARNTTLGVRRALKLLRTDAGSADSTDRLLCEAQAAARLVEPAIVRVFDFGKTAWGDPYLVMEMLDGEDLMSIIRRRERLSPDKAARVLLPVIRALASAHAHGIVHRDLKPENIFLAKLPDGRVQPKLLDFGIAKLKNGIGLRLTTDGAVMGSPLYMAPEQARGEDVDERADVWALSVVLYESITGQPPFSGDDRAAVAREVARASPPRLSQHDVADDSLWPIISRGLEKQRDDRWTSMEELGRALARWLLDRDVGDDITGASLEAGWFRTSRQSLFGSSVPPLRSSLADPDPVRLIRPAPRGARERAGQALAMLARHALAVSAGAVGRLRRMDRTRRYGIGTAAALASTVLIAWMSWPEPDGISATPPGAPEAPAPTPALGAVAPVLAAEPATLTAPASDTPEAHDTPRGDSVPEADVPETDAPEADDTARDDDATASTIARAPSRESARPRRKAGRPSDDAAKRERRARRRSRLIDPYQ